MDTIKCPRCGAEVPVGWRGDRVLRCAGCGQGMYAKVHPSTGESVPVSEGTFNKELNNEVKYLEAQIYKGKMDTPAFQELQKGREWAKEQRRKIEKERAELGGYTTPWRFTAFLLLGNVLPGVYYMLGLYTKDDDPIYWGMVVVSVACWFFCLRPWVNQKFMSCFGVIFGWAMSLALGLGLHLGLGLLTVEGTGVMENTALGKGISGAYALLMLGIWVYYFFVYSKRKRGNIQRLAEYKKEVKDQLNAYAGIEKKMLQERESMTNRIVEKFREPTEEIEGLDPRSRERKRIEIEWFFQKIQITEVPSEVRTAVEDKIKKDAQELLDTLSQVENS